MANATVSHLGVAEAATYSSSNKDDLFLKIFGNEVLATFNANTVLRERTRIRTIQSGKSASFAMIGKTKAEYHTPGAEILGNEVKHNEQVITIDDMLIAHTFISNYEEAKNHYDVRSEYSLQMGQALAQTYDRNLFAMAGKETATPTGSKADQGVAEAIDSTGADSSTTTTELIDALYSAAQKFAEKNVTGEINIYVPPAVYFKLVQDDKVTNRDFSTNPNDFINANLLRIAGMPVVMTNNMALNHNATANTANYPVVASKYDTDMSGVLAMCIHREALGTVQLMGLATESEYDIRRQGQLAVARLAVGHGVLRPEGLISVTGTMA